MAIALDSVDTRHDYSSGTSHSYSYTNTAGDVMFLCIFNQSTSGTYDTITGATYNSVTMTRVTETLIADNIGGVQGIVVYKLENPATGSNTLEWTQSAATSSASSAAITYSGFYDFIDSSSTNYNNNTTQISDSVGTTSNNSWCLVFAWSERALTASGGSVTPRLGSGTQYYIGDSTNISPAGTYTATIDVGSGGQRVGIILVPFASQAATSTANANNNLLLLGVS